MIEDIIRNVIDDKMKRYSGKSAARKDEQLNNLIRLSRVTISLIYIVLICSRKVNVLYK